MATSATVHFTCPNCSALYHVVKAEPGPETTNNPEVACHICSAPLPAREGQLILKYFLLRKAGAPPDLERQATSRRCLSEATERRFPPPWTVEGSDDACFIVRDKLNQAFEALSDVDGEGANSWD